MINYNLYKDLFKNYYRTLVVFAVSRYGLSRDEAEDIVQDLFIKIWNKRDSLDSSDSLIRGFLYTSVRNASIDVIRTKKRQGLFENKKTDETISLNETIETTTIDFENEVERSEKIREVYVAIETLPKKCKEIFKKIYFEEKDYYTVALEMGLSVNTVKVQMFRAYAKLRSMLIFLILFIILSYFL